MTAMALFAAFLLNAEFELDERGCANSTTQSYRSVVYDGLTG